MFCPVCHSEFVDGVQMCPNCNASLVSELTPPASRPSSPDPVAVLRCSRAEPIAIAKSILLDAGIEFGVRGEQVQDLFGYGRFPLGTTLIAGPMEVLVAWESADDAKQLLSCLERGDPCTHSDEVTYAVSNRSLAGVARPLAKLVAAIILATFALELVVALTLNLLDSGQPF